MKPVWARPIHFVYLLLDAGEPFYVGYSRSDMRLAGHVAKARTGTGAKNMIIRRILAEGRKLEWRKVAEGLTRPDALALEAEMIANDIVLQLTQAPRSPWRNWVTAE